jgi:hypothetical protein
VTPDNFFLSVQTIFFKHIKGEKLHHTTLDTSVILFHLSQLNETSKKRNKIDSNPYKAAQSVTSITIKST